MLKKSVGELEGKVALVTSTTVSRIISRPAGHDHTRSRAAVGARRGQARGTSWRRPWAHGLQAAPGTPRGLNPLGRQAGWRKASG